MEIDKELKVESAQPDYNRKYTVAEYHTWDESFRAELYEGDLVVMEVPTRKHQKISGKLFLQLGIFLNGKPCEVYYAPFGVRLSMKEESIFEPDIVVVCDESILTERGCIGAPDMVIEILSPSTARRDKKIKFAKYKEAGVREYWIVDPDTDQVQVNIFSNNECITKIYNETDIAPVTVLKDCEINLSEVFEE